MKKMLFLLVVFAFSLQAQEATFKIVKKSKTSKPMLVGVCSRAELLKSPFGGWFKSEYDSYKPKFPDKKEVAEKLPAYKIVIVMGTWCPDSRREVPRFYKILDSVNFPENQVKLITVNRKKEGLAEETKDLNIQRVPTFIFYKNGTEAGRIIEHPSFDRLEDDIENIIHSVKK